MGPEVGPAFQRRSRDTPSSNPGVRLAERWRWGSIKKETRKSMYFLHVGRGITYEIRVLAVSTLFAFLSRVGARDLGIPAFAPRSGPPHARAPGAQMIRIASGSSLAFQRLPPRTPNSILDPVSSCFYDFRYLAHGFCDR
eukprot:gene17381-biopygen18876